MDYKNFEIEDFLADDYFKDWIINPNESSNNYWEEYLTKYPSQAYKIEQAAALIRQIRTAEDNTNSTTNSKGIWQNIQHRIEADEKPVFKVAFFEKIGLWRMVASVAMVLFGLGWWFVGNRNDSKLQDLMQAQSGNDLIKEVNHTDGLMRVHLTDGSVVSLEKNSSLSYYKNFKPEKREVFLEGEAFFEVAKMPNKPFFVYANDVVTKVLGTSFRVKAYENDKNVVVSVRTGRVSVFARKDFEKQKEIPNAEVKGVVLTPNQEVVYLRKEDKLNKKLVEDPILLTKPTQHANFEFENTPVAQVFVTLERAYGIDIVYDEELMKDCSLTAPLGDEPLYDKLKLICKTLGASYEIIDAQVVIYSRGCR